MSLTTEDKDWIASTVRTIVKEDKDSIASIVRTIVKEETRGLATIEALALTEARIERVETTLSTEFHKSADPAELKLRSHRDAIRALDLQIEAIAGRVAKLEGAQGWQLP